jgi:hypothetical protein
MVADVTTFPVVRGLAGMNKLAQFLNAAPLTGGWHFGPGTRFDQTAVTINFDNPDDLAPAWKRYCDAQSAEA